MFGRVTAYAAWGVLVLALLGGCGGEDGGASRPSLSPTISPTRTLPEPTRTAESPEPSETDGGETTSPEPEPTEPEPTEPEPTETQPEPEPTEVESTEAQPEPEPEESEAGTPSDAQTDESDAEADAEAGDQAEDDGTPPWLWWLLAGLAALAVLVIALIVRSRRRGSWHDQYDEAVAEVTWFARELLPQLRRAGSVERMVGGWQVESAKVGAVEDRLTGLEATAPNDTDRARTRNLRDAVRMARGHMQELAAPGQHPEWALDVDDVIASLEAALGQAAPPSRGR